MTNRIGVNVVQFLLKESFSNDSFDDVVCLQHAELCIPAASWCSGDSQAAQPRVQASQLKRINDLLAH